MPPPATFDREITAERVRAEMSRVLRSDEFAASQQLIRFLRFIVDESLAGRADLIKERSIAVKALDRDRDFDPRLDCIVRVVAGKLRRALERYYAKDGANNPLRIEVPKGRYRPVFHAVNQHSNSPQNAADGPVTSEVGRQSASTAIELPGRRTATIVGGSIVGLVATLIFLVSDHLDGGSDRNPQVTASGTDLVAQVGALPYRVREGAVEVLLVRTLRDSHWTVPKASQNVATTVSETAAKEAFKEAGVHGVADTSSIGVYFYQRRDRSYRVDVYPILVDREASSWPEISRGRRWCDTETAGNLIASNELANLVRRFDPKKP